MDSDRLLAGLKLLVIEDEEDTRELLAFILTQAGAEVIAFIYVYQALEAFDQFRPDVILSNVHLPDGDGYKLLRAWRQQEAELSYAPTPAILVTESEREVDEKRLQQAGYQTYITRPFNIERIVQTVADVVQPNELNAVIWEASSMNEEDARTAQEDWFSRGKEDGLLGRAKQPPEIDPEQASLYDLGYGEGSIQRSLSETATGSTFIE